MKAKKIISFLMCAVMLTAVLPFNASATDVEYSAEAQTSFEEGFAEGQVLFMYTQTVSDADDFFKDDNVGAELAACGITYLEEIPTDALFDTSVKTNEDGTYTKSTVFVGYTDTDTEKCCEKVKGLASAEQVSLNYYMHCDSFAMPTEITNPNSYYTKYTKWWFENSVHITDAWQQYDTFGAGSVVAVIDSGVCVDNPEIADNIWTDSSGHRGYNAETLSYNPSPIANHGSNVAGIIAGSAGNNPALIGVAPEAKIMAINVMQSPLQITPATVVAGINYAIENGADVITMSLSTTTDVDIVRNACAAAYNAGVTVIASASNTSKNTTGANSAIVYPAAYSTVIGVMAYGSNNQLSYFSNYDTTRLYYDIAAPGEGIIGLPPTNTVNSISIMSGTSQATPIVAGLAALYYSLYPDHTPAEFRNALMNACTDTVQGYAGNASKNYTFQRVDALKLLGYYDAEGPTVEAFPGTPTVIDDVNNFIYGLEEGYGSIDDYVSVGNGDCEFIPTENGNGTGSILRVYALSGEIYKDYEIVIFGDTDGDAICDGMDCAFCQYVIDGGETADSVSFACDVDFDGRVNQNDLDIITMCGLKADYVAQIR